MKKIAFTLSLIATFCLVTVSHADSGYVNQDTWVWTDAPNNNYDSSSSVTVYGGGRALLRYESPGLVSNAVLNVYVWGGSTGQTMTASGIDSSWDASTVTWNTQPTIESVIDSVAVSGGSPGWYELDVTNYVNDHAGQEYFSVSISLSSGGFVYVYLANSVNAPFLDYTLAVLEKPTTPAHCYDMDTNIDVAGNFDITLNGATVGDVPGVLDGGLELVNPFFAIAETLSNYTASGPVTAAVWVNAPTTTETWVGYKANSSTGWSLGYFPSGDVRVYSDSNNVLFSFDTTSEWDFIATTWGNDAITTTINTLIFTDTLTSPTATSANMQIASDDGVIDQLMIWNSELSTENMAWLYNGGRGRSCWELVAPTAVELSPMPTPAYFVSLDSGARGDVYLQATAGEIGIITALFVLCGLTFLALFRDSIALLFRKLWSR